MENNGIQIATVAMLQRFFDQSLLAKLAERGAITAKDAGEIAVGCAEFAHELADEQDRTQVATLMAVNYEQIAEAFRE
ncbi:hypothetical protein [Mesorhizobium sp. 8]|uniref:hypothetical protein n=1 Tax=Mesorhizobium sp. 8 TaxID=2584466 RepID=UPI00111DBAB7|nr:hypothetical protein [Mesorhizobium sp. 8]QDB99784.1 hypothetical protein FGU64_04815 [Mesorhizobium sp. 8]